MQRRDPANAFVAKGICTCAALAVALQPLAGYAMQTVDARDGSAVEAVMSIKEPTRIRIEGAPITDVFGSIYANNCSAVAPTGAPTAGATTPVSGSGPVLSPGGEVIVECDRDKGEIYIRPVAESGKPINLFVSSALATYTLILRRADTPADTILIRDRSLPSSSALSTDGGPVGARGDARAMPGLAGTSSQYVRALKSLLVGMASGRPASDVRVDELQQPVQLWAEVRFALLQRFEGRGLVGERYQLTNVGEQPLVLAEQEFDRPDSPNGQEVVAVSIESHNLRSGESTSVYVIRRGGTR